MLAQSLSSSISNTHQSLLANFFTDVERAYHRFPDVPYHNNLHGADVLHGVHVLLDSSTLVEAFSDLEVRCVCVCVCVCVCFVGGVRVNISGWAESASPATRLGFCFLGCLVFGKASLLLKPSALCGSRRGCSPRRRPSGPH
jgi:hypothetical protein